MCDVRINLRILYVLGYRKKDLNTKHTKLVDGCETSRLAVRGECGLRKIF
jgi:hypothetical protein